MARKRQIRIMVYTLSEEKTVGNLVEAREWIKKDLLPRSESTIFVERWIDYPVSDSGERHDVLEDGITKLVYER